MKPKLTVLAGPTGSGKTALSLRWAREANAEIVSADSQQVYRFFDIGTAKPSTQELAEVPHHLISVVDPLEPFSAARYQALADEAIGKIAARNKRVLVVGGTGLYLRVLLHGVTATPGGDLSIRAELERQAAALGREHLYQRLLRVDPATASKLSARDQVRVIRALEIHALTGVPASEHRARHRFSENRYPFEMRVLDLPGADLYRAIDQRTRRMFECGLVDEVRRLCAQGFREAAPMKSVGYAEACAVAEGRVDTEEAIRATARRTRRYAKRQLTWFRREPGARFVSPPYA